jgi:hypothetical protein
VERAADTAGGPQASEYRTCARKGGADQRADLDRGPQAVAVGRIRDGSLRNAVVTFNTICMHLVAKRPDADLRAQPEAGRPEDDQINPKA